MVAVPPLSADCLCSASWLEGSPADVPPPPSIPSPPSRVRYWPGGNGLNSSLLSSLDNATWHVVSYLDPSNVFAVTLTMTPPLAARFLAVRHIVRWGSSSHRLGRGGQGWGLRWC